jgi:phosphoserine phosphatase SerB
MNGEIDFKESLRQRVGLLHGVSAGVLEQVRQKLVFTEGAKTLCAVLKRLGVKMAVISGGFIPLAKYVKHELGLDYAFANELEIGEDGNLTGKTIGSIVDAERKAELLGVIAQTENISREHVMAVGDGANDLLMLAAAGLGIAFNAKPKVQLQAEARINQKSLHNVLYLLGYTDTEINQLVMNT